MHLDVAHDVPLAPLTTLQLGGHAHTCITAHCDDDVATICQLAENSRRTLFVLGGGSNLVVGDAGHEGIVLRMGIRGIQFDEVGAASVLVRAGAGEPWDELVAACIARDLAGVECLSGIPGSTGATPIQNVGAYGQEVSETIEAVRVYDRHEGMLRVLHASECDFGYRDSMFKRDPSRFIVVQVDFRLQRGGAPAVRYAELERALASDANGESPSLARVREVVLQLRRGKSMVLDPTDPNSRSAGSFFTNPILTPPEAEQFFERALAQGDAHRLEDIPHFAMPDGVTKLAAAWLIERAGFHKGYRKGPFGLSSRHALALVHHGGGTTRELLELVQEIRMAVLARHGVVLVPEPVLLGCTLPEPSLSSAP